MSTRRFVKIAGVGLVLFLASFAWAEGGVAGDGVAGDGVAGDGVAGDYVEARNCDVWTGPCFANGEINLRGSHAVMAWAVRAGTWNGSRLDGLKVAVSLDAEGTLGTDSEGKVRAVLYIDRKASEAQAAALTAMAKKLAPGYLDEVVQVQRRKISFSRRGGYANLEVARPHGKRGAEVKVKTKPLGHGSSLCGSAEQAYPALAKFARTKCTQVVSHFYRGLALGPNWNDPDTRGAMTGSFQLRSPSAPEPTLTLR